MAALNLLFYAQFMAMLMTLWLFTTYITQRLPTIQGKRILLLIAHPDDEAMFFAPVLQWLTRPDLGNTVVILCMSSGDADGLGETRKKELRASALQLGVRSAENVVVLEDERLPDSMTKEWDPRLIGSLLTRYFAPKAATAPTSAPPPANLDVLITFDRHGVSGHPNHIALFHGSVKFLQSLMQRHPGWECPVRLYALASTNIVRKYISVFDSVATITKSVWLRKERAGFPTPILVVSGPRDYLRAQGAMTTAHRSQMRWFRWGWITISRYMIVNDLQKVKIPAA